MATKEKSTTTAATYFYALGRRKTATATVRLYRQPGSSTINGKELDAVSVVKHDKDTLLEPLKVVGLEPKDFHITAKVNGGGHKAQIEAIRHGLARAIIKIDENLKKPLKSAGMLTRDPRMVERKKPGLHKSRKAEQFSKR